MMFFRDRETVLDTIAFMGSRICGYMPGAGDPSAWPGSRCDCKYGADDFAVGFGSEHNGCPELRSIYFVVATMTDAEWLDLLHRAGGVTSDELREGLQQLRLDRPEE